MQGITHGALSRTFRKTLSQWVQVEKLRKASRHYCGISNVTEGSGGVAPKVVTHNELGQGEPVVVARKQILGPGVVKKYDRSNLPLDRSTVSATS